MQRQPSISSSGPRPSTIPGLSSGVVVGRNSRLYNLTTEDKERLGGIEYRSLRLLLKAVTGKSCTPLCCFVCVLTWGGIVYFFGIHLFGALCLLPWIHRAPEKYTDYLRECGQDKTWWYVPTSITLDKFRSLCANMLRGS